MRVVIENEGIDLEDGALLGQGGEGRVYRLGKRAVKIFHATPKEKADKLRDFPRGLPRGVVGPIHLATDPKSHGVVGYTMDLVEGATDAFRMSSRRFRQGVMRNDEVCALLRRLHGLVGELHSRDVVVGDLNDGNVVFTGTQPWMLDTDSMQFGRHLCTVAHERFLDPRLFGKDFTRAPAFDAASDWYAFAVMTFASLLFVHPYGGQHPTIPTMLRRAEARHSVLRPDVAYPRAASPFAILSDDMLDVFTRIFDAGARGTFPAGVLSPRWTVCSCGVEHARTSCPSCATRAQVPAATTAGMQVTRMFTTKGRIVAAVVQGGLRYAYVDEHGVLRREDGVAIPVASTPGMRVAIAGASTWVHDGVAVTHVVRGEIVARLEAAAFDAGLGGAYHATGDWLYETATGARVGQVLAPTTWLRVGDRFAVGFYRAGRITVGFVVRPGRGMLRAALPQIAGRLIDATATFDGDRVLVAVASEENGRRTHTLTLVSETGAILAGASGAPESRPLLASVFGKCMAGGAIVASTDDGLLLARASASAADISETKTFAGTRDFVAAGTDILAGPRGSVYLVHTGEILQLTI